MLYIFYKFIPAAVLGGAVTGIVYVFVAEQKAMDKRIRRLRVQFFDLLEAMSVAMRAGNPVLKALESAPGGFVPDLLPAKRHHRGAGPHHQQIPQRRAAVGGIL